QIQSDLHLSRSLRITLLMYIYFFFFNAPPPTEIYTLSLHDALPISSRPPRRHDPGQGRRYRRRHPEGRQALRQQAAGELVVLPRSEEHTSELQSRGHLVCRLLLEKKKEKLKLE